MLPNTTLLIFESDIDRIVLELRTGVIRMASNNAKPFEPLRPGREIELDPTGQYVKPNENMGISLAGTLEKLKSIWSKGRENYLFVIDRNTQLEEGFAFNTKDNSHWMIILNRKMRKEEYISKLNIMKANWKCLGRYIKNV